jgi:hypothetical protein
VVDLRLQRRAFYTDDTQATVAELKGRGVKFGEGIADHGYGLVTHLTMPGGVRVQLYQPKYEKKRARPRRANAPHGRRGANGPIAAATAFAITEETEVTERTKHGATGDTVTTESVLNAEFAETAEPRRSSAGAVAGSSVKPSPWSP